MTVDGQAAATGTSAAALGRRAGQGVVGVVLTTGMTNVLQLASSLLIARALAPSEYGAFAVAATVVGFGRFLGDGGAGSAVIQRPGPDTDLDRDLGRALAVQGTLCLVLATLLAATAPLIRAAFDAPPETTWIVIALAGTLLLSAPTVVPEVRLRRQQRYQRRQALNALSLLTIYLTQIGGLLAGLGVGALVLAHVVGSLVTTTIFLLYGGGLVRPVWTGALRLARSGWAYQGSLVVQSVFSLLGIVVVGSQLPIDELGLVSWCTILATPLIALGINLHTVTFPALSRLHEHHPERHAGGVSLVARTQLLCVSAVVGVLGGLATPLIAIVFDEKWLAATTAARWALLGVLPLLLAALLGAAVESTGRPQLRLRSMAGSCLVGLVVALPLAAVHGPSGAAFALYLLVPLVDAVCLAVVARVALGRAVLDAVVVGGVTGAAAAWAARSVDAGPELLLAVAGLGVLTLVLLPLVDLDSLRRGWRLVRPAPEPG